MPSGIRDYRWRPVDHEQVRVCPLGGHELSGANLVDGTCRACSWARSMIRAARTAGDPVLPGDLIMYADDAYATIMA